MFEGLGNISKLVRKAPALGGGARASTPAEGDVSRKGNAEAFEEGASLRDGSMLKDADRDPFGWKLPRRCEFDIREDGSESCRLLR
jgi:hypothetical protein